MRFESAIIPYAKGMVLEAASLNRDFSLLHSLLNQCSARYCDGIISGLLTYVANQGLELQAGVFRLNGKLGWLSRDIALEMPPANVWSGLWLAKGEHEGHYRLFWMDEKEKAKGLRLCRLKLNDKTLLRDSWLLAGEQPENTDIWLGRLNGVDYVQLEYAMAASLGKKPTLLPAMQKELARLSKGKELTLWLMTGLLPFMDYFGSETWDAALACLISMLKNEKQPAGTAKGPHNFAG